MLCADPSFGTRLESRSSHTERRPIVQLETTVRKPILTRFDAPAWVICEVKPAQIPARIPGLHRQRGVYHPPASRVAGQSATGNSPRRRPLWAGRIAPTAGQRPPLAWLSPGPAMLKPVSVGRFDERQSPLLETSFVTRGPDSNLHPRRRSRRSRGIPRCVRCSW